MATKMATEVEVLRRELQEMREENAALLEALHLAQRGVVDLRGHLSKWNPDATAQGIFTQDWELRYFILSGTLLKYYSSERDVGIEEPRGVLELQDCYVEVELPIKHSGPFVFQIKDPDQELLLRLSADHLKTAKTWVRTLAAAGLLIQGFERLSTQYYQIPRTISGVGFSSEGLSTVDNDTSMLAEAGDHGIGATTGWSSMFGRVLSRVGSFRGLSNTADTDINSVRQGAQTDDVNARSSAATAAAAQGAEPSLMAPAVQRMDTAPPPHPGTSSARSAFQQHYIQQQQQQLLEKEDSVDELQSLQHLQRLSTISRKTSMFAPSFSRAASARRWEKPDIGDELPSPGREAAAGQADDDSDDELNSEQEQLQSQVSGAQAAAATTGVPADRFMSTTATAAAAAAEKLPTGDHAAVEPSQPPQQQEQQKEQQSTAATAVPNDEHDAAVPPLAAAPLPPAAVAAGGSRAGSRPRKKPTMTGASPVHTAVKDSVLTWVDEWSIARHEGLLNLGVVVLLATNIRMIMSNIFTYGLRLRLHRAVLSDLINAVISNRDDWTTLLAVPGCLVFAVIALLIELLGCGILRRENKMLEGLIKKDTSPADLRRQLSVMASRHEWLLFALNVINVGASLLLPCWLVLSNSATLLPASALTFAAIVTNMKLVTYAHCNTTLRQHQRRQQLKSAAGESSKMPSGAVTPQQGSAEGANPIADYHQQTHAAAAAAAAAAGGVAGLDPATFFINGTTGSEYAAQEKHVSYPGNLNLGDLLYYMLAPTLSYQLNFPRLRKRRWRLLARWCVVLVVTSLMMGFMQVQFLLPLMQSSIAPLREMNMLRFTERLLRLSIPSLVHWLAMFFLVFHLYLNILGELLMFGDRVFYKLAVEVSLSVTGVAPKRAGETVTTSAAASKEQQHKITYMLVAACWACWQEWWNAATLADYWKLWNMPVHKWMLRSIYFPLVRRGVGKFLSLLIVFFVSAVMHELAVGVPLRMLKGWAFYGMCLQVPLISLTEALRKRLKSDTWGNIIFWASFCVLGQPMCLILYYHDWLLEHMGMQGIAHAAAAGAGAAAIAAADSLAGGGAVCGM